MRLPNARDAIVSRDKLENYLLDLAHPFVGLFAVAEKRRQAAALQKQISTIST